MKFVYTLIGLLAGLGITVFATVLSGEKIKAVDFNNNSYQIGDIKKSILNDQEFQSIHGNCWKRMNTNISLSGTDLGNHILNIADRSYTSIPNASGRFLRNSGGKAGSLGSLQDYATVRLTGSITHRNLRRDQVVDDGASDSIIQIQENNNGGTGRSSSSNASTINIDSQRVLGSNHVTSGSGSDIRPDNITINMFVKINNDCE